MINTTKINLILKVCLIIITLGVGCMLQGQNYVCAAMIPIDETHFPDEYFRKLIALKIDGDKDNVLSEKEIGEVTSLTASGYVPKTNLLGISYEGNKYVSQILDFSGIEYFTEITEVSLADANNVKRLDISKNKKIIDLNLGSCENFEELILNNNISVLTMYNLPKLKKCDLSKLKKLRMLEMKNVAVSKIKLETKKLGIFTVWGKALKKVIFPKNYIYKKSVNLELNDCSFRFFNFKRFRNISCLSINQGNIKCLDLTQSGKSGKLMLDGSNVGKVIFTSKKQRKKWEICESNVMNIVYKKR